MNQLNEEQNQFDAMADETMLDDGISPEVALDADVLNDQDFDEALIEHIEIVDYDAKGNRKTRIQWYRRLFHISSALVPLSVLALGVETKTVLTYYWPLLVIMVLPEIIRLRHQGFNRWFCKTFGSMMRPHEQHSMHTAAEFAIAVYFGAAVFGIETMMVAFLCLSLADPVAAIVGIKFGRVGVLGKTLEGFVACGVVCAVIAAVFYPATPLLWLAIGLTGAVAELIPIPGINDNVRIPVAVATVVALFTTPSILGFEFGGLSGLLF